MKEVSGKIVNLYLTALPRTRWAHFLEGMPFREGTIPERIDWDDFCLLSARIEELLGGSEALVSLGASILRHSEFSIYQAAFQFVASPRLIYWASNRWGGPSMFSHIINTLEDIGPDQIRITLTIPSQYASCPQLFAVNQGLFASMPRILGLPDAVVVWRGDSLCGSYTISMPPSLTLWARLRRSFGVLFSARLMFEELGRQQESLKQRYAELEQAHARIAREHQLALEARDAAERALRVKSEFLSAMSHEIRTPLHGVLGATQLLQGMDLSPDQQVWVDALQRSGQGLNAMLDDILDFSRLDSQVAEPAVAPEPFSIRRLLEDVHAEAQESAHRKGLALSVSVTSDMPESVLADAKKLSKVLRHLLDNAIKFTHLGEVVLQGRLEPAGALTLLRLEVHDTGMGIAEADLPGLFQPFTQVDSSITRRYGGSGLGLAICSRLIQSMGGQIGVNSTPGMGSVFWCSVPLVLPAPIPLRPPGRGESTAPAVPLATPAVSPPLRILVAEDNLINQQVLLGLLRRQSAVTVVLANDGQQALERVRAEGASLDLVLMDCHMPVMDGFEATRQIRLLPGAAADIPILAVTADVSPGVEARCREAGMDGYLDKPITRDKLAALVERWLVRRQSA